MTAVPERLAAAVERAWAVHAPSAAAQVALLQDLLVELRDGTGVRADRTTAAWAAHQLAGCLGSFGREGSSEARELELLLRRPGAVDPADVERCVRVLADAVGRP